jgi:hypothetical protein
MSTYELLIDEKGSQIVKRTNADDTISWIPTDPANSDYQRYLNPEAEHFTPILPN